MVKVSSNSEIFPTRIQSVSRASKLIRAVAAEAAGVTARELASRHQLALPTAHHLLATLVSEGVLARTHDRRYVLGPVAGEIAASYDRQRAIPEDLLAALGELASESGETAYLAAWRGESIEMLRMMESRSVLRVGWVATEPYRHPHARAVGKVLLAFASPGQRSAYLSQHPPERLTPRTIWKAGPLSKEMDRVRKSGFALDLEEFTEGVSCVAAPIIVYDVLVAACGLAVPTERFNRNRQALIELTARAAKSVSRHGALRTRTA